MTTVQVTKLQIFPKFHNRFNKTSLKLNKKLCNSSDLLLNFAFEAIIR